jgi:acetoacetate decarboxylase
MSPEDVLKLPSMPANGPSFPAGPYRFIDREFMVISYETDPEVIRHQMRHDAALWPCAIHYVKKSSRTAAQTVLAAAE